MILIIIVGNLNIDQLLQWGWRVPFLIGALTAFVGLLLRLRPLDHLEPERKPEGRLDQEEERSSGEDPNVEEGRPGGKGGEGIPPPKAALSSAPIPAILQKAVKRSPLLRLIVGQWHVVLLLVSA